MSKIIGYGVSTRHEAEEKIDTSQTIAMQELAFLGFDCGKIIDPAIVKGTGYSLLNNEDGTHSIDGPAVAVEVVRSNDGRKPMLSAIIECLEPGDTIVLYSLSTLFKGQNVQNDRDNYFNGCHYYREIVDKGINLLAFDFSGGTPRISEYSSVPCMPSESLRDKYPLYKKCYSLLERVPWFAPEKKIEAVTDSFLTVVGKRIRENYVVETEDGTEEENRRARAFQAIYFAYESYMISGGKTGMTLSLLKEYCGITTMVTFWRMAADFEKSIYYEDLLNQFCKEFGFDIFEYPKRCGKLPQDLENLAADIRMMQSNFPDGNYSRRMVGDYIDEKHLLINPDIYHRWHLTTIGAKKPRKPPVDFDLQKFRQVYKF